MLRLSPQQEVFRLRVVQTMATRAVKFAETNGTFSAVDLLNDALVPVSRQWRRGVVRAWEAEGILERMSSLGPRGAYLYRVGVGGVEKLVAIVSSKDRAGVYLVERHEDESEGASGEGDVEVGEEASEGAEPAADVGAELVVYLKQMVGVMEGFSGRMERNEQEQVAIREQVASLRMELGEDLREALREFRQSPAPLSSPVPVEGPNVVLQSQLVKLRDEMGNIRKLLADSNELKQLALEVEEKPILKLVEQISGDSESLASMRSDIQSQVDTLMDFREGVTTLLEKLQARDAAMVDSLNGWSKSVDELCEEHVALAARLGDVASATKKLSDGVTSLVNGLGTVSKISSHLDEVMDRAEEMEANTARYAEVLSRYHEIAKFVHESLVMSGIIPHLDDVPLKTKTGATFALIGTPLGVSVSKKKGGV